MSQGSPAGCINSVLRMCHNCGREVDKQSSVAASLTVAFSQGSIKSRRELQQSEVFGTWCKVPKKPHSVTLPTVQQTYVAPFMIRSSLRSATPSCITYISVLQIQSKAEECKNAELNSNTCATLVEFQSPLGSKLWRAMP